MFRFLQIYLFDSLYAWFFMLGAPLRCTFSFINCWDTRIRGTATRINCWGVCVERVNVWETGYSRSNKNEYFQIYFLLWVIVLQSYIIIGYLLKWMWGIAMYFLNLTKEFGNVIIWWNSASDTELIINYSTW